MIQVNIGDKFTNLIVIAEAGKNKQGKKLFTCQCSCGTIITSLIYDLVRGHTKSCGCLRKITLKKTKAALTKHNINIGDKFDRLTVVGLNFSPGKRIVNCLCSCGSNTDILVSNLVSGKVRSCGCYRKEIMTSENPWLTEYNMYKDHCAIRRNLDWELSLDYFSDVVQKNCIYCNSLPKTITKVSKLKRNGIDRIDSSKGYVLDNCVSCCKICNHAKNNLSTKQFLDWIQQVYITSITSINCT